MLKNIQKWRMPQFLVVWMWKVTMQIDALSVLRCSKKNNNISQFGHPLSSSNNFWKSKVGACGLNHHGTIGNTTFWLVKTAHMSRNLSRNHSTQVRWTRVFHSLKALPFILGLSMGKSKGTGFAVEALLKKQQPSTLQSLSMMMNDDQWWWMMVNDDMMIWWYDEMMRWWDDEMMRIYNGKQIIGQTDGLHQSTVCNVATSFHSLTFPPVLAEKLVTITFQIQFQHGSNKN